MNESATVQSQSAQAGRYQWLSQASSLVPTEKLYALSNELKAGYQTAVPYPHVVIDNMFDEEILDRLLAVFPDRGSRFWHRFDAEQEVKLALDAEDVIPVPIRLFLYFLNGSLFISFLEQLTGIPGLIPDPHWNGGGLHQIERGGKLGIHADFNKQDRLNLDRRLNLLLYLNKDWLPEYGGDFELWDRDMTHCIKRVAPLFNRMVVFSTTDYSFHGHPDELKCPFDRTRRSLALYYYSNGRPEQEVTTVHSTLFQPRPGETFKGKLRRRLKPYVPPVLFDLYDRATG